MRLDQATSPFSRAILTYTGEQLERMVARSRFGRCEISPQGIGLEVRLTKAITGPE